ncbi:MAG: phosphoglycerate dehydrogenase [Candidatus Omnitrophica bacterium]|nr:phosphoglycerate dehydrogenase [Candidatus Omnitrophota bacterium]
MIKILVSDPLSEEGLKILRDVKEFKVEVKCELKKEELLKIIKDYHALIVRSATKVTADVIKEASNLKVIGRAGVGLDNVDLEAATSKGIIVMNTPGGNTISTAEHTVSMMLALSRNIPRANTSMKAGEWKRSKFMGSELYGKTLGVVGLGRIGSEVAKRAASFGMKIIAYDPFLTQKVAEQIGVKVVELKEVIKSADYITVHTPLTDDTRHMLSDKEFAMMKKGVKVINCARGGIIDEAALAKAIKEGKVAGAAIDVFEKEPPEASNELLRLDAVVATPHLGASTEEAQVNVAIEVAEVVRDALLGKGIRNAANYPCIDEQACKILDPYIGLSEKIGLLAGQLIEGRLVEVNIIYSGEIVQLDSTGLTLALMKGVLTPMLQDTVNFINALSLSRERGIKVSESKISKESEFVNFISVDIKTDKQVCRIAGTLSANRQPRIVKINEFYVEIIPAGHLLVINNWDRPGIIGNLGTLLGEHKINIAGMSFGRVKQGGEAITVLNVDSALPQNVLEKIRKAKNILSVKTIKL